MDKLLSILKMDTLNFIIKSPTKSPPILLHIIYNKLNIVTIYILLYLYIGDFGGFRYVFYILIYKNILFFYFYFLFYLLRRFRSTPNYPN